MRKKLGGGCVDNDVSLIGSEVQRGQTRQEFDLPGIRAAFDLPSSLAVRVGSYLPERTGVDEPTRKSQKCRRISAENELLVV